MGNERYPRDDYYGRSDSRDHGRDTASERGYSSTRDHQAAGIIGPDRGSGRDADRGQGSDGRGAYGARDYGGDRYAPRDRGGRDAGDRGRDDRYGARDTGYHGSYASDGRRFEDVGRNRHADDDDRQRGYGRQPQGDDHEDRGFFQRAGDEVRSWFGDDEAERRRDADTRHDERGYGSSDRSPARRGGGRHDDDYHSWRTGQIAALDRDYDEYRHENRSRFESEFATWRTARQGQRDQLGRVQEHQEVVGSDGAHVGTVDKIKGDRILLTKNDVDAGGQHHSIPSNWIASVGDTVMLTKTAAEAKQAWQDEDRGSASYNYSDNARPASRTDDATDDKRGLNRSFSGTY